MNGGILTQRSDDNLGEEDEIDCLVDDDDNSFAGGDVENDGTLLRDSYTKVINNGLLGQQYLTSNEIQKKDNY
jgi:hypothetical protein